MTTSLIAKEFVLRSTNSIKEIFLCGQRTAKFLLNFQHFSKPRELRCENNRIQQLITNKLLHYISVMMTLPLFNTHDTSLSYQLTL